MQTHLGTSGYAYKEWLGSFYPEKLSTKKMLPFYAARFSTVEANNTFYRMPSKAALEAWRGEVPPGFVFALKAPQRITHFARLKEESYESLAYFLDVASVLGPALGPLLFQLPPNLKRDDARLAAFLERLPRDRRAAFEFRHESWFDEAIFTLLAAHNASLVISESEKPDTRDAPLRRTANWVYLRLRKETYDATELDAWAARLQSFGVEDAFVYFKHEDAGQAPVLAQQLGEALQRRR